MSIFRSKKTHELVRSGHMPFVTVYFNREISRDCHPATGSVSAVNQVVASGVNQLLADCITSTSKPVLETLQGT